METKKLLLVDGHSLIHRAYHAYPRTLATKKGELTNAVYGFTNMLLTAIGELAPTHVGVAFDLPKPTFREQIFVGYKQSRVKPDDDMIVQIPRIKQVVEALNIPIFEVAGFEADDVIGTLARQAASEKSAKSAKISLNQIMDKSDKSESDLSDLSIIRSGPPQAGQADLSRDSDFSVTVIILTSDRDLMQLIRNDRVAVKLPPGRTPKRTLLGGRQGESFSDIWNEDKFSHAWGFPPHLLPDSKALAGDQSDDIPGVRGIGEKTAKQLVAEYGGIDDIYRELFKGRTLPARPAGGPRQGSTLIKKLAEGQESAQLSKKLATIDTNVPLKFDWKATEVHEYEKEKVLTLFNELQFKSLVHKLPNDMFEQSVQDALF